MPDQEREPTPEQEAEVSRLLAEARATEPLPAEVAARLERVLVGLGEERAPATPGHVVALAGRRRRATVLLVAAAAVVAIGVGLGQIVDTQTSGSDDSAGSSPDSALVQDEGADRKNSDTDGEAAPEAAAEDPEETAGGGSNYESGPPLSDTVAGRVRIERFTADANQLRRAIPDDAIDGEFVQLAQDQLPRGYVLDARTFECAPADWGPGVLVPVFFDGSPAVLAYRPVTGESQVVDLLQCGTGNRLRSTTLQAG